MGVSLKKYSLRLVGLCCLLTPALVVGVGTAYNFPTNPTPPGGPLSLLDPTPGTPANADSLTVSSDTMRTTNATAYTVLLPDGANGCQVTVNAGATLSYAGTDTLGKVIFGNRNSAPATAPTDTITNRGTINNGPGTYAIYLQNSNAGANNIALIDNYGSILGSVVTSGIKTAILDLSESASISGLVNLATTAGDSSVNVGLNGTSACNYTSGGSFSNIGLLTLSNAHGASSMTLNHTSSSIKAITIGSTNTLTVNAAMSGANTDGAITNNGTLVINANISKTSTFTTSINGNTKILSAVTVTTAGASSAGYNNLGTHTVVFTDTDNYGKLTLSAASPSFNLFVIDNPNKGFVKAGTYVLVSAPSIGTAPTAGNTNVSAANTLFSTFSTITADATSLSTTVTRTGYQTFTNNDLLKSIATNLENIGASSPTTNMLSLLNAIEKSTTSGALISALKQLTPLISAPLHGFEIQNEAMEQVALRLASVHDGSGYMAGSAERDNSFWVRPYGNMANQKEKEDSAGYYAVSGGLAVGLDRVLDTKFTLGAATSYSLSHVKEKINPSSLTLIKSYQAMLYGTYNFTKTRYLDWVINMAANNYRSTHYININGVNFIPKAKYSSQQFSTKGIWGKDYAMSDFSQITPMASLQYTYAKQYTYSETDGGGANQTIVRENSNTVQVGLGGKLSIPLNLDPAIFSPEIHAMFLYNVINGKQNSVSSFVDGGGQMLARMNLARAGLKVGCGFTMATIDRLELKLNVDREFRDRYTNSSFYFNFKYTL